LIICEWAFEQEDPNHRGYSLAEVDFYTYASGDRLGVEKQHRLTMRKNLQTNEFEVLRHYGVGRRKGTDEVIFSSKNFREALQRANQEGRKYVKYGWQDDVACEHQPAAWAFDCPKRFV
jgi:hypothetical protein